MAESEASTSWRRPTQERVAVGLFVVAAVAAVPVILHYGRQQWFFLDEWDFLAARDLHSLNDLFRPHNEHWVTIPIVLYRVIWKLNGANAYWLYQLPLIAAHLATAALVRALMRRAGADPWTSTLGGVLMLFLGSGRENLVWAFQISFVGALAFGLAHLVLADHDGPAGRRDLAGIACGVVGLMFSGVAICMVFGVGLAVLMRRGWRLALLHVAPPATVFLVWFAVTGRAGGSDLRSNPAQISAYLRGLFAHSASEVGGGVVLGLVLALLCLVGVGFTIRDRSDAALGGRRAAPVGLACASVLFGLMTAYGRALLGTMPAAYSERYVYLLAAMWLPMLGLASAALTKVWLPLRAVIMVVLAIAIVGNFRKLPLTPDRRATLGGREGVLDIAYQPRLEDLPADFTPFPTSAPEVTVGWLRSARRAGKLPERADPSRGPTPGTVLALSILPLDGRVRACDGPEVNIARPVRGQEFQVDMGAFAPPVAKGNSETRMPPAYLLKLGSFEGYTEVASIMYVQPAKDQGLRFRVLSDGLALRATIDGQVLPFAQCR